MGASIGLVLLLPVLALAALAVRARMGSPVLFRQKRPGLGARPFYLLKFRTMREPRPGEQLVSSDRDRLTPLGQFLRRSSIDELPTLINVLRGEMSLVGPRPLLWDYLDRYSEDQARRHLVVPGVTGWAQINGRNAIEWEDKLRLDVWYVDNWSFWLDLVILFRTVGKVLRREDISRPGHATTEEFRGRAQEEPSSEEAP